MRLFAKQATLLTHFPLMGYTGYAPGTREWMAHPSYVFIYKLTKDTVCILRVLHTARHRP